jgi:preprotein translocase subunit SecE
LKEKKMSDAIKKPAGDAGGDLPAARRVGPLEFFQQVRREMTKVTWPSWKETWVTTLMVFIMVALTMLFFFGVDFVLSQGERLLIGAAG